MTKKQKRVFWRICASAILLVAAVAAQWLLIPAEWEIVAFAVYLPSYIVIAYDILAKAARTVANRQWFDENFLMSLATVCALTVGFLPDAEEQYAEAVFVMLFYQVGELFQSIAVGKSRRSISSLMDLRPDVARVERNGERLEVDPTEVEIGEVAVVMAGEKIPLDGVILEGESSLNTVALTGEAAPRDVGGGDEVLSGCINLSGILLIRVTKSFGESTVSKILELVESSAANKSKSEAFITRFARWYTPCVVVAAVLLALIPPMFDGLNFARWVMRALSFLVISCPCALVISVPLSFFGGIGGASKRGILIKGSNYLEALSAAETAVFDKTGTLTEGAFEVSAVEPKGIEVEQLLRLAALAEMGSTHPVAASLRRAAGENGLRGEVSGFAELAGKGVTALVDGQAVAVGNARLMADIGLTVAEVAAVGTAVHVAVDGEYRGYILISDRIKPTARGLMNRLKRLGVSRTVMLTGDRRESANAVAEELGLDEWRSELLPTDKVSAVENLLREKSSGSLLFVGDGINDAPVLSLADVGVAMGALGSDAAIEAADVVLMDDNPEKLVEAVKISRRTMRIVRQNIWFALTVKGAVLLCGALGLTGMWMAIFADVGVAVIAILNAMRTLAGRAA